MKTPGLIVLAFITTFTLFWQQCAVADGGFFKHERRELKPGEAATGAVRSPKQEAILVTDGDMVQVILRTQYRAGPQELAWVVPVPAEPMDITAADGAAIDALDQLTAPKFFEWKRVPRQSWGCACSAMAPGATAQPVGPSVQVHQRGEAGLFEFVVLSTRSGDALLTWLNDHHYLVPGSASKVADHYARQGWYWLAMRLRSDAKPADTQAAHPISYVYRAKEVVFPMVISSVSADDENEVVLHVLSDKRYACRNWMNGLIDRSAITRAEGTASGTNYESIMTQTTRSEGGHVFFTEYAMPVDDARPRGTDAGALPATVSKALSPRLSAKMRERPFVTRLRAIIKQGAMDKDVLLAPAEDESMRLQSEIHLSATTTQQSGAPGFQLAAICGLLLAAGLCFGGSSRGRTLRLICAGAALCLLAML